MTMKRILVQLGNGDGAGRRLTAAVEVARWLGSGVVGLHALPLRDEFGNAEPVADRDGADLEQALIAECGRAGIAFRWVQARGDEVDLLAAWGHHADMIVVGRGEAGQAMAHPLRMLSARLVVRAGAPILVLPPDRDVAAPFARVMVAWKETREAARALRDALPFLRRAKRVVLLSVQPPAGGEDRLDGVVGYLAAHGIDAQARVNFSDDAIASDVIRAQAKDMDADLVVMGAYGSSRLVEVVLGGVTQRVLERAELPVLISH